MPAYANWLVGLEFAFKDHLTLDLSYVDTNLSKEDCFVFTGDTDGDARRHHRPDQQSGRPALAAVRRRLVGTLTAKFDCRPKK